MADRDGLRFLGFIFATVTLAVMLTAAVVVKSYAGGGTSLDRSAIASHSSHTHDAAIVTPTSDRLKAELFESGRIHEVDVIGLDEVQFFDHNLTHLAMELVHLGKRVILAGLDTTFANEPFGPVPNLMALADEVTKLSAVCMVCGAPAIHTQRLGQSQELVVVGAAGLYEARCRTHFEPFTDEHHSEQLDLLTA